MNLQAFHMSVQGASHIKHNKECQDASLTYDDAQCHIAVVCDGHGGDDYVRSAKGSELAAQTTVTCIREFVHMMDEKSLFLDSQKYMHQLKETIYLRWHSAVYEHYKSNPLTDKELSGLSDTARKRYAKGERIARAYGTTLIAVAVTPKYWFGLHIGDGKCVGINGKGEFKQPIPWDTTCFLNVTTSLCDSDGLDHFRHFFSKNMPVALFVGSDGVDDSFKNDEQLYNFYKTITYAFANKELSEAAMELEAYLPRLSEKGSGDDISIAAILDMDAIPELEIVKAFNIEKEKARIAENERLEKERQEKERQRIDEEFRKSRRLNGTDHKGSPEKEIPFVTAKPKLVQPRPVMKKRALTLMIRYKKKGFSLSITGVHVTDTI